MIRTGLLALRNGWDDRGRKSRLGHIQLSFRHTETLGFRTGACRHHHSTHTQKNDMVPP